ncbi:hypothetical protein Tco_0225874, partial [Tanacetum coccineum]
TTNLRNEISNFEQRFGESFHEAWDRYKDLLRAGPHHGFTELHQLDTFYNALNPADQDSLNSAAWNEYLRKERKTKPKRQNQARNGKAGKRQSQSPSLSVKKSTQVNPDKPKAKSQEKQV